MQDPQRFWKSGKLGKSQVGGELVGEISVRHGLYEPELQSFLNTSLLVTITSTHTDDTSKMHP